MSVCVCMNAIFTMSVCMHERGIYNVGVYARTRYLQCRSVCTNAVFTMSVCMHERGIYKVGVYAPCIRARYTGYTRYLQTRDCGMSILVDFLNPDATYAEYRYGEIGRMPQSQRSGRGCSFRALGSCVLGEFGTRNVSYASAVESGAPIGGRERRTRS